MNVTDAVESIGRPGGRSSHGAPSLPSQPHSRAPPACPRPGCTRAACRQGHHFCPSSSASGLGPSVVRWRGVDELLGVKNRWIQGTGGVDRSSHERPHTRLATSSIEIGHSTEPCASAVLGTGRRSRSISSLPFQSCERAAGGDGGPESLGKVESESCRVARAGTRVRGGWVAGRVPRCFV